MLHVSSDRNHECHREEFVTEQETFGIPVVAAIAASTNSMG